MENKSLSIIIIAGNEATTITDCLNSALFADEIILIATAACTPTTIKLAKLACPKIIIRHYSDPKIDFSSWHNFGSKIATSTWLFHLDCDERISPNLKSDILSIVKSPLTQITNYDIPRANYFLGKRVLHGNTYPDYVKRLYLKSKFISYVGALHEQPQIIGQSAVIKSDLIHLTHRDLSSMLSKSLKWTSLEAQMLHRSHHPPVVWWRFLRMMLTKFIERVIKQRLWLDGPVGWISAIFEVFDTYIIYARLWEIQQHET